MSMREKMLKSAINSMMDDYDESVQRMEIMSKRNNTPFIRICNFKRMAIESEF